MAGGGGEPGVFRRAHAGGAADVEDARLRGEIGETRAGLGRGEIEHALGVDDGRQRIVGDGDIGLAAARQQPRVLAERDRPLALERRAEHRARRLMDGAHQHPAHAARRACHHQPHVAHEMSLRVVAERKPLSH